MLIGIDGNEANVDNRVGSNAYAFEIIKAINKLDQDNSFNIYLKDTPFSDFPSPSDSWQYRVLRPTKAWTQWRLPLDLYTHIPRPKVFYSPGHYAPRTSPVPTVVTVMDLAFLKFPNLFLKFKRGTAQLTSWTEYSVKNAKRIIAISKATKSDIVDQYQINPDLITVAYPGIDQELYQPASNKEIASLRQKYALPPKFLLFVGTLQPRKNLVRLLEAFARLPQRFKSYHLVLAGQKGWHYQEFDQFLKNYPQKDKVHIIGFIDEEDKKALYSAAACLCLISLYEGFGMPPAEAIACQTLPIVSNNSSLPEVVGEAGFLVDPYSVKSINHAIIRCLSIKPEEKKKRLKMLNKHIKQFNWATSARKILKVLYDVAV